jgi:hypothetical protein
VCGVRDVNADPRDDVNLQPLCLYRHAVISPTGAGMSSACTRTCDVSSTVLKRLSATDRKLTHQSPISRVNEQVDTKSPASLHELVHQHQLVHSFQSSAAGGEKYSPARPRGTCDQIARAAAKIFESRGSHAYRKKQLGAKSRVTVACCKKRRQGQIGLRFGSVLESAPGPFL